MGIHLEFPTMYDIMTGDLDRTKTAESQVTVRAELYDIFASGYYGSLLLAEYLVCRGIFNEDFQCLELADAGGTGFHPIMCTVL